MLPIIAVKEPNHLRSSWEAIAVTRKNTGVRETAKVEPPELQDRGTHVDTTNMRAFCIKRRFYE